MAAARSWTRESESFSTASSSTSSFSSLMDDELSRLTMHFDELTTVHYASVKDNVLDRIGRWESESTTRLTGAVKAATESWSVVEHYRVKLDNLRHQVTNLQSSARNHPKKAAAIETKIKVHEAQIEKNEAKMTTARSTFAACEQELVVCEQSVDEAWVAVLAILHNFVALHIHNATEKLQAQRAFATLLGRDYTAMAQQAVVEQAPGVATAAVGTGKRNDDLAETAALSEEEQSPPPPGAVNDAAESTTTTTTARTVIDSTRKRKSLEDEIGMPDQEGLVVDRTTSTAAVEKSSSVETVEAGSSDALSLTAAGTVDSEQQQQQQQPSHEETAAVVVMPQSLEHEDRTKSGGALDNNNTDRGRLLSTDEVTVITSNLRHGYDIDEMVAAAVANEDKEYGHPSDQKLPSGLVVVELVETETEMTLGEFLTETPPEVTDLVDLAEGLLLLDTTSELVAATAVDEVPFVQLENELADFNPPEFVLTGAGTAEDMAPRSSGGDGLLTEAAAAVARSSAPQNNPLSLFRAIDAVQNQLEEAPVEVVVSHPPKTEERDQQPLDQDHPKEPEYSDEAGGEPQATTTALEVAFLDQHEDNLGVSLTETEESSEMEHSTFSVSSFLAIGAGVEEAPVAEARPFDELQNNDGVILTDTVDSRDALDGTKPVYQPDQPIVNVSPTDDGVAIENTELPKTEEIPVQTNESGVESEPQSIDGNGIASIEPHLRVDNFAERVPVDEHGSTDDRTETCQEVSMEIQDNTAEQAILINDTVVQVHPDNVASPEGAELDENTVVFPREVISKDEFAVKAIVALETDGYVRRDVRSSDSLNAYNKTEQSRQDSIDCVAQPNDDFGSSAPQPNEMPDVVVGESAVVNLSHTSEIRLEVSKEIQVDMVDHDDFVHSTDGEESLEVANPLDKPKEPDKFIVPLVERVVTFSEGNRIVDTSASKATEKPYSREVSWGQSETVGIPQSVVGGNVKENAPVEERREISSASGEDPEAPVSNEAVSMEPLHGEDGSVVVHARIDESRDIPFETKEGTEAPTPKDVLDALEVQSNTTDDISVSFIGSVVEAAAPPVDNDDEPHEEIQSGGANHDPVAPSSNDEVLDLVEEESNATDDISVSFVGNVVDDDEAALVNNERRGMAAETTQEEEGRVKALSLSNDVDSAVVLSSHAAAADVVSVPVVGRMAEKASVVDEPSFVMTKEKPPLPDGSSDRSQDDFVQQAFTLNIHRISVIAAPPLPDANAPETSSAEAAPSHQIANDVVAVMTSRAIISKAGDVVVAEKKIEPAAAVVAGGVPTTTETNASAGSIVVVESLPPADLSGHDDEIVDQATTTADRLVPVVESSAVPPAAAIGAVIGAVAETKTGTGVAALGDNGNNSRSKDDDDRLLLPPSRTDSTTTQPKASSSSSSIRSSSTTSSNDGFEWSRLLI
jgi:hypothetical protein